MRASTTDLQQNLRLGAFQISTATDDQFQLMQFYDPQVDRDTSDRRSSQDFPTETVQDGFKHDLVFTANLWDHEFSWINSVNHIEETAEQDLDFSPIPLLFFLNAEDYDQISSELRIVSPLGMFDGKLDYVTGLYLAKSQTDITVIIDAAPNPSELQAGLATTPVPLDFGDGGAAVIGAANGDEPGERLLINGAQEGDSSAIYGQATWHFTDQLSLTGGIRYSREEKSVDQTLELFSAGTDADGPVFTQAVLAEEYRLITSRVDEDLSLKLALTWNPNDDITLYSSVAEGFKGGGYSGSAVRGDIVEVEPESSITAEVGAKSRLFDGGATLNVAVFYTEFEELQLTIFEGSTSLISNAAGAISQGVEIDSAFVTPWGITGNVSLAYLDATFTDYTNGPCPAGEDTPCDVTGEPLARAPEWKGSVSVNYFNDLADFPINVLVGFDYLYQDDQFYNADQDPNDFQEAYATTNYRLKIADDDEQWSVQALLRNATNKHAIDSAGDVPTLTGAHFGRSIAPRTLDVTVQLRF